jgi:hypothetical protein
MRRTGSGLKGVLAGTDNTAGNDTNEQNDPAVCIPWPAIAVQSLHRATQDKARSTFCASLRAGSIVRLPQAASA